MKAWQLVLICGILIVLAVIIISILPGNAAVFETLKAFCLWVPMAAWSSIVVTMLFGGPFAIGALYRTSFVSWIDKQVERNQDMGGWSIFFLGLALSLVIGAIWIVVAMLSSHNGWVPAFLKVWVGMVFGKLRQSVGESLAFWPP